ncbi:hypothetical protein C5471_07450 [Photorhabdus tasmaniensis]|uniref:Uncharacterized protein n=1 Tax=Photorhabdus tasmaniensis TaxID=1004159 RepID=A0ABX0GEP3_9GAMM|nr:hypothetical protein [Photorhabdus tasmaniensis]
MADKNFSRKFRKLTVCHAIDFIYKCRDKLSKEYSDPIYEIIKSLSKLGFTLDLNVRFSFKRKFLKIGKK